jgi:hypothetical protein
VGYLERAADRLARAALRLLIAVLVVVFLIAHAGKCSMARGVPERKLPSGHTFDPTIPGYQFDRIGKVAAAWSHLEATLDDLIWHFLDLCDEDGRIITSSLDARPKIELAGKLADRYFSGDQLDTLKATLNTIGDLRLDRNFIVHGVWGSIAPDKRLAAALSFRPKAPPGHIALETFPPIRMTSIADGIDQGFPPAWTALP